MEVLLAIVIVVLVAAVVSVPLRRSAGAREEDGPSAELADLEARKEVVYREIRDAENDHAAGKLSDQDFKRLDGEARREAIEILKRIDGLKQPRERDP